MSLFNDGSRSYQDRFDTRRLADRIDERLVRDWIDDDDRAFIERCDMLFIATADADGRPQCSYKGGDTGFVHVVDEHTIAFPNYDGNGMFLSAGNALVNPHVGLLFINFDERKRLRLNGTAEHVDDDPLLGDYPEAQFLWRVRADRGVPELSALHPPLHARRALALRAEVGLRDARAGLETSRLGRTTCCPPTTPRTARARGRTSPASKSRPNIATTSGSNCVPADARRRRTASSAGRRCAVRAVGDHRVERVADEHDARLDRNLVARPCRPGTRGRPSARGRRARSGARRRADRSARGSSRRAPDAP